MSTRIDVDAAGWQALLWDDAGRRLASAAQLRERLGGDDPRDLVLAGDPVQFGAYALWVLELAGLHGATLLDGGGQPWVAGSAAAAQGGHADRIDHAGVRAAIDDPRSVILDVRSAEEFSGVRVSPPDFPVDHGATVAGHIPGARHLPYTALLDDRGSFRSPAELEALLAASGVEPDQRVITYCRLGHRAALAWFALRHVLGRDRVAVYEGSWTEWGSLVGAPVAR